MNPVNPRKWSWHEVRQHAQTRPAMYIGSQATGHKSGVTTILRLIWQAKVFRHPGTVTVDLSPTQYVVRAECGALIKPVQQIFSFGTGDTLGEPWADEMKAFRQRQQTGLFRHDWRYCFSGPTGPSLDEPAYNFILARGGGWGLRTNAGLWCEAYRHGIPVGRPYLLENATPFGLFAAASLDPQWFTGLPFSEEDAHSLIALSNRRFVGRRGYGPHPNWTCGEVVARWHPQDGILIDRMLKAGGLAELL